MKRDFSDEAKERLLALVDEVEGAQWCSVTDWIGDRWLDVVDFFGQLSLNDDLSNVDDYHSQIIDKNNISREKIEEIFSAVTNTDTSYATRFGALATQTLKLKGILDAAALVVAPGDGTAELGSMDSLNNELTDYEGARDMYEKMAGDGLSSDEVDLSSALTQQVLADFLGVMTDFLPNIKVGEKFEIAIGVGLTLYYSLSGKGDLGSDVDAEVTIEEDKASFKDFSYSAEVDGVLGAEAKVVSDGESEVSVSASGSSLKSTVTINSKGEIETEVSNTVGNRTYSAKTTVGIQSQSYEESIKTDFGQDSSIKSTLGIKQDSSGSSVWVSLPVPAVEQSPVEISVPSIDVDWRYVAVGAIGVVAVGALIIATGGAAAPALCLI